ncbi:phosphatidylinositol 4-phosphate 5-kinase 5-like [Trichoplusia ni]|uniref:Phosphatidylinositol 4-phosphate 5-kinase 5-like n=1 Tax=Trichoplusia ni TaxID=7111 RepID=A0A7E5X009_TRINI|nr:phosphatidylinositol 4-phosphate 5-kinase 5-like [Trichoplusia ni]
MTDTPTEADSDVEVSKKPAKEVPVVQDHGFFKHTTGDLYDGYFEAKKKDRSVRMHGPGVYTTAEGDCYTGLWESDKFGGNEEVSITYVDGSTYKGQFKDWYYNNHGQYTYPDGSLLDCDFIDNCPVGHLRLTDPNGHVWLGKADSGYGWFEPVNHFFEFLDTTRESTKVKRRHTHRTI